MTFTEITRLMLSNMDFFQLRNVANKYDIAFRGVRRQQLMRNIERAIVAKSQHQEQPTVGIQGAMSAKPVLNQKSGKSRRAQGAGMNINTFSARNSSL